jgi:large subunit ribosomal protein L4
MTEKSMSLKVKVYNQNAESVGEMELSPKVFGVKVKPALVYQAVVTQMANMRKVLAHTLIRSEVRGGGKKPWAQKGTGRARHGSSRSPIWRGGGVTFGPRKDRNFKMRLNKKMRQGAMLMALSDKVANEHFIVLDKLEMAEYKTKVFDGIVEKLADARIRQDTPKDVKPENDVGEKERKNPSASLGAGEKTGEQKTGKRSLLIVVDKADEKLSCSARNLPGVALQNLDNINIVDLLKYKDLVMTKGVVEKLVERYIK